MDMYPNGTRSALGRALAHSPAFARIATSAILLIFAAGSGCKNHEAEDRSVFVSGEVTAVEAAVPLGYTALHTAGKIQVDGKVDEEAWTAAKWTAAFVDIQGDSLPRPEFETRAKILWDDEYLYVAAKLEEPHVWGTKTARNSRIYDDNDFEVFIDPDGDGKNYYEIELNALNTVWNLLLFRPYSQGGGGLIPHDLKGQLTGVHVQGTVNDPGDTDEYWTVEFAFPWSSLAEYAGTDCPPKAGDRWRINFSRVEYGHKIVDGRYQRDAHKTGGGNHPEANWVWSPQGKINMHIPEMWGYVRFSEP